MHVLLPEGSVGTQRTIFAFDSRNTSSVVKEPVTTAGEFWILREMIRCSAGKMTRLAGMIAVGCLLLVPAHGQEGGPTAEVAGLPDNPLPQTEPSNRAEQVPAASDQPAAYQTKRILGVIPNFRSVSADAKLPPQTPKDKLLTGVQDSFDYSAFIFAGAQAGVSDATKATPQFGNGAVAYGRYYWHTLADQADENFWVESIVPVLTHEDSRYYTLGHGGVVKRAGYAVSRAFIARNDKGRETFNASEVVGAGAAAGISGLYYPSADRTFTKTYQRWITSVTIDSATFLFKEFWPDVNQSIFHQSKD